MGESTDGKVIVIVGPTAVGKTKLGIDLAHQLNGEVISGDSMQIYRSMDIGTAKVTREEMDGVPHHMIDIRDPEEPFSVAEFQALVRMHIREISERGKVPIIVGGTGLYIQSVLYDYTFSESDDSDLAFRLEMEQKAGEEGVLAVHRLLQEADPESAERIHPNNVRRVIRALEVHHTTGRTMSEMLAGQEQKLLYETALIGLTMEREKLYDRINRRIDLMMEQGLLQEVQTLHARGIRDCQAIQAIGYKELYEYLDGHVSLGAAVEALKTNSRRYAKRQFTWFRNKLDVSWFDVTQGEKTEEILQYIAGKLRLGSNKV